MNSSERRNGAASPKPRTTWPITGTEPPSRGERAARTRSRTGTSPIRSTPRPSSLLIDASRPFISRDSADASASVACRTAFKDE